MLEKLWEQKRLRLYESVASLDELIGYETFKDGLKIWFEGSQDTNLKTAWGFSVFRNCSIAMVSHVTRICKILITKLDRDHKATNRNIEKAPHGLEDQPLRIEIVLKFY